MPNAQNQNAIVRFIIDDDMRFEWVCADWRVQLFTQPRGARCFGKKRKHPFQAIMIAVGLRKAELFQSREIDG